MARSKARPQPTEEHVLDTLNKACAQCGRPMWFAYENQRSVSLLDGRVARLRLRVRRCQNQACVRYHVAYRPEEEGRWALPEHEFGLEVIAAIGAWRYTCTCVPVQVSGPPQWARNAPGAARAPGRD